MTVRVCLKLLTLMHSQKPTCPHISTVRSFHIFASSHTCVIMLCLHITLKTPTTPQLSMQYTTTTHMFFLQPLPVPPCLLITLSVLSVRLMSVLETHVCVGKRMWDATVVGCWCAIEPCFPETKEQLLERTHLHTWCIHSVWNWECLYSQRNKDVSCVYDCLCFSWPEIAYLTVSHSAVTRRMDWTCEHSAPTFCGCIWLSEHVCLCWHSWWQRDLVAFIRP